MKIYEGIEQGTREWKQLRELKFTASHASTIMANGKGLQTLVKKMLAEYYSSGEYEEYSSEYKNSQMQRGNDFEDKARMIYELETGEEVKQVTFVELNKFVGASPDGLVGEHGLIEIKNHNDEVFLQLVLDKKIDKKYLDQMQMQMYVTGRQWCDYFGFNPNFNPSFVKIRVFRDPNKLALLEDGLKTGVGLLVSKKKSLDTLLNKH